MLSHLIYHVLICTQPRTYLKIKKCSRCLNVYTEFTYKQQFIREYTDTQIIRGYKIITYYGTYLNNHKIKKELILVENTRQTVVYPSNYIYIIRHKLYTNKVKVMVLTITFNDFNLWKLQKYQLNNIKYLTKFLNSTNFPKTELLELNLNSRNNKIIKEYKSNNFVTINKDIISDLLYQQIRNHPIFIDLKSKKFIHNNHFVQNQ